MDRVMIHTSGEPCGEDYLNTWEEDIVFEYDHYDATITIERYERVWNEGEGEREPRKPWPYILLEDEQARKLRDCLDAFLNRERRDFRTNPVTDAEVEAEFEALAKLAATYGAKEGE